MSKLRFRTTRLPLKRNGEINLERLYQLAKLHGVTYRKTSILIFIATHLQLVPKFRMCGAFPTFTNHGTPLHYKDNFCPYQEWVKFQSNLISATCIFPSKRNGRLQMVTRLLCQTLQTQTVLSH